MRNIDVAVVGGGPAGSTCAAALVRSGFDVALLERMRLPRDKVCAGWITPDTVDALGLDLEDYARRHVFQPLTALRVRLEGRPPTTIDYGRPVSHAVRRVEFDDYLARRSRAWIVDGAEVTSIQRVAGRWVVDGWLTARYLVGAGGHRCPVAKHLNGDVGKEVVVVGERVESRLTVADLDAGTAELVFLDDLRGYQWLVPKGPWVNIGVGRNDPAHLPRYVRQFADRLAADGRIEGADLRWEGHAYLLGAMSRRRTVGDGLLLVGDAAGVAAAGSGEGINHAVRSGLMAADAIRLMAFERDREAFSRYADELGRWFGTGRPPQSSAPGGARRGRRRRYGPPLRPGVSCVTSCWTASSCTAAPAAGRGSNRTCLSPGPCAWANTDYRTAALES